MKPLNLALEYLLDELQQKSPEIMGIYEEWNKGDHRESLLNLVESSLDGSRRFSALVQAIDDIKAVQKALDELFLIDSHGGRWRWVAVDENGKEYAYRRQPRRIVDRWYCESADDYRQLPPGTIHQVTGDHLLWEDEPIDLFTFNINNLKLEHLK